MIKFVIYKGLSGRWYWRAVARNGRIIADGGEGYASRGNAVRAVGRFTGDISDGRYDWPPS